MPLRPAPRGPSWPLAVALVAAGAAPVTACGSRTSLDFPAAAFGYGQDASTGTGPRSDGGGRTVDGGSGSGSGSNSGTGGGSGSGSNSGTGSGSGASGSGCGGSGAPPPPSCTAPGMGVVSCGSCGESCCENTDVPAETYFRTYTNDGTGPMGVADPATLSAFRLDKYLVTVGRFRQFVDAWSGGAGYHPAVGSGKHTHLNGGQGLADVATPGSFEQGWPLAGNGWIQPTVTSLMQCGAAQSWTPAPGPNESLPVNCMNWYEAYAFCIWDGGFLPSEAEWELVAAGGDEQREYAWGAADPGTTNQYAIYAYSAPTGGTSCYYPDGSACSGLVNIAPVGTALLGVSKWGQLDMAGELGEWVMDGFAPYVDPCTDCANLSDSSFRVIRGGAYDFVEKLLAPTTRNGRYPPGRNGDVGFRCARAP